MMTYTVDGEKHRPILLSYHRQPGRPASSLGLEVSAKACAASCSWVTAILGTSQRHTAEAESDEMMDEHGVDTASLKKIRK
jgi:hypothetical protein